MALSSNKTGLTDGGFDTWGEFNGCRKFLLACAGFFRVTFPFELFPSYFHYIVWLDDCLKIGKALFETLLSIG